MPAYNLRCDKCQKTLRKILPKFEGLKCSCGGDLLRTSADQVSTVVKEILDNGVMVRKVERIHNVDELMKERSKQPKEDDFI